MKRPARGQRRLASALLGTALASVAFRASGAESAESTRVDDRALGNHQKHVRVELGARTQFISSAGLDPFSENDVIPQLSMAGSYVSWTHDRLSLAAVVGFDYGGSSAHARSDRSALTLYRFGLAPEARYHVLRVLALTAKVGPSLTHELVSLEGGLGAPLVDRAWKLGFDATLGVAVELWGYHSGASNKPRLWATGEGGYGWTAPMKLGLVPQGAAEAPERLTPLALADLSLSGPLFRITVALSFW